MTSASLHGEVCRRPERSAVSAPRSLTRLLCAVKTWPARLANAWHGWLFAEGELRTLAVFRVGWALAMLTVVRQEAGQHALYAKERYHVALFDWAVPLDADAYQMLMRIAYVGVVMTLVGSLPQLGVLAVISTLGYVFALDMLLFKNHVYLGLLMGVLLSVSPCARAFSVEALIRRRLGRPLPARGSRVAVQLIKAQVLIVYGWSVLNKLRGSFLDGWTLQRELPYALQASAISSWLHQADGALRPAVAALIESDRAMSICAVTVVAIEALLFFGLQRRSWRRFAMLAGVALHGSIMLLMNVVTFGLLMVASYPLFLEPAQGARATQR